MWTKPFVARGEIFKDEPETSGERTVKANPEELDADIGGMQSYRSRYIECSGITRDC